MTVKAEDVRQQQFLLFCTVEEQMEVKTTIFKNKSKLCKDPRSSSK